MSPTLISVDLETSGTLMGASPIIAIGACLVEREWASRWDELRELLAETRQTPGVFSTNELFYCEINPPEGDPWSVPSEAFHGLSPERLAAYGISPVSALSAFGDWVRARGPAKEGFRLVSHNAAFDWAHLGGHFVRYGLNDPFDPFPACTKNIARGRFREAGDRRTGQTHLRKHFGMPSHLGKHNALADALSQAVLFARLMDRTTD